VIKPLNESRLKYYPDMAFVSAINSRTGEVFGYSALGTTDIVVKGSRLGGLLKPKMSVGLNSDPPRYYTTDIESVWYDEDNDIFRGWVHVETPTCSQDWLHGEIYYSESKDGIVWDPQVFRFSPPDGYSNWCRPTRSRPYALSEPPAVVSQDWVITSGGRYIKTREEAVLMGSKHSGVGAHWVIASGNYLYLQYTDHWAERLDNRIGYGICLARANKASGGKPGTWLKYYRGSFSEAGVGGKCSVTSYSDASGNINKMLGTHIFPYVVPNTDRLVHLSIGPSWAGQVVASTDASVNSYRALTGVLLYGMIAPDGVDKTRAWYISYNSLHEDEEGRVWWYCMMTGSEHKELRSTVRFPVTVWEYPTTVCGVRWAISKWIHRTTGSVRITLQALDEDVWDYDSLLGYASTCRNFRTRLVTECYAVNSDSYFVALDGECEPGSSFGRVQFIGPIGNLLMEQSPGTLPLYRCYIPSTGQYDYVTSESACMSATRTLLGFAMPPGRGGQFLSSLDKDPYSQDGPINIPDDGTDFVGAGLPIPNSSNLGTESANTQSAPRVGTGVIVGTVCGVMAAIFIVAAGIVLAKKGRMSPRGGGGVISPAKRISFDDTSTGIGSSPSSTPPPSSQRLKPASVQRILAEHYKDHSHMPRNVADVFFVPPIRPASRPGTAVSSNAAAVTGHVPVKQKTNSVSRLTRPSVPPIQLMTPMSISLKAQPGSARIVAPISPTLPGRQPQQTEPVFFVPAISPKDAKTDQYMALAASLVTNPLNTPASSRSCPTGEDAPIIALRSTRSTSAKP